MGTDATLQGIPDLENLVLVKSGITQATTNFALTLDTTVVAHNLGYVPICFIFISYLDFLYPLPFLYQVGFNTGSNYLEFRRYYDHTVDAMNITINFRGTGGSGSETYDIKYYLFRNVAK